MKEKLYIVATIAITVLVIQVCSCFGITRESKFTLSLLLPKSVSVSNFPCSPTRNMLHPVLYPERVLVTRDAQVSIWMQKRKSICNLANITKKIQ